MGNASQRDSYGGVLDAKYGALRFIESDTNKSKIFLRDGTQITPENVITLYKKRFNDPTNKPDALLLGNVIEVNFETLLKSKEQRAKLLKLSKKALINLLQSDNLLAPTEYCLLILVGAWVDRRITRKENKKKKKRKSNSGEEKEKERDKEKEEEQEKGGEVACPSSSSASCEKGSVDESAALCEGLMDIKGVVIPESKRSESYEAKLRKGIAKFAEYIRFPTMSHEVLEMVVDDGLISSELIYEALRYHVLVDEHQEEAEKLRNTNPRCKSRNSFFKMVWDSNKKDTRLNLAADGTVTVVAGTSCYHKTIIGKYPITCGRVSFALTMNQMAGCTDAIGVVDSKFKVQSDLMVGIFPNSWGLGLYAGSHVANSDRRLQLPQFGCMSAGTVIKVIVDMEVGTIEFFVNGTSHGKLKGVRGPVYPAMTMCERVGSGYVVKLL